MLGSTHKNMYVYTLECACACIHTWRREMKNKTNQEALHILHTLGVAQEVSKTLIFSKNRRDLYKQASRGDGR